MYVVFIVLNHREKLPEILEGMSHLGSHGATVMDSMGSRALDKKAYSMPMIGGLLKGLDGEVAYNNTIFSVIEREEQVERILEYVKGALAEPLRCLSPTCAAENWNGISKSVSESSEKRGKRPI